MNRDGSRWPAAGRSRVRSGRSPPTRGDSRKPPSIGGFLEDLIYNQALPVFKIYRPSSRPRITLGRWTLKVDGKITILLHLTDSTFAQVAAKPPAQESVFMPPQPTLAGCGEGGGKCRKV